MAWSNEARAAALEVRRMHARAKKGVGYSFTSAYASYAAGAVRKGHRKMLARAIKALRRNGISRPDYHYQRGLLERAASSTAARNHIYGGSIAIRKLTRGR